MRRAVAAGEASDERHSEQGSVEWAPPALVQPHWRAITPTERGTMLIYSISFLLVSLLALWLQPDPRGVGTHEQLGLPPCSTQALLHIPCPFCGMTTAFSLMVHGRFVDAFFCQPAGAAGYVLGAIACVGAFGIAATGRYPALLMDLLQRKVTWGVGISIVVAAWIYKIIVFV